MPKARGFILKLGANGARVSGFGTNGDVLEDIAAATLMAGIVDHDGKFVMVGGTIDPTTGASTFHTSIARFAVDGTLDTSFGTGGDGWTEIVDQDVYNAIDVDELADGRLWITAVAEVGLQPDPGRLGQRADERHRHPRHGPTAFEAAARSPTSSATRRPSAASAPRSPSSTAPRS